MKDKIKNFFKRILRWIWRKFKDVATSAPLLILIGIGAVVGFGTQAYDWIVSPSLSTLRKNAEKYCTAEQIASTGTIKCEESKKAVKVRIVKLTKDAQAEVKKQNQNVAATARAFEKADSDARNKCSTAGMKKHGAQGCEDAKKHLERTSRKLDNAKKNLKKAQEKLNAL